MMILTVLSGLFDSISAVHQWRLVVLQHPDSNTKVHQISVRSDSLMSAMGVKGVSKSKELQIFFWLSYSPV